MNNKITIPEDVVDRKAYLKYLALGKNPILQNPYFATSDGEMVSLSTFPSKIREQTAHLAPAEQEAIMEAKSKYNRLIAQRGGAKAQAYRTTGQAGSVARRHKDALTNDCIELLGKMFTPAETVQILGEEYGISVAEKDVTRVLKKNLPEIERRREEYRAKVTDVRLYSKRSRLEELGWMYSRMKQRYVALNSEAAYNAMLRTLEQIRKEAEGDMVTINGAVNLSVEIEIQQHIQAEIYKSINLKEIILGRVAARMGYDLSKLVAGLHNSYYARFVQISGAFDPNAQMTYPSASQYDFTEIAKHVKNEVEDIKAEDVTDAESTAASTTKEFFLQKIREQKVREEQRLKNVELLAETAHPTASAEPEKRDHRSFADRFIRGGSKLAQNNGKV